LIGKVRKIHPDMPMLLMTRYGDIRSAVSAIKSGAFDYITKPVNPDELLLTVNKALNNRKQSERKTGLSPRSIADEINYIRGTSPPSLMVEQYISLIAPTDMSVIIQGESGTGKEYVARMIHLKSPRKHKSFVAVDCGAMSNELAASELFGHAKGAFTDAHSNKEGQFQQANEGTLFLDEIGNLSYENQLKLLRATQERKVRQIGGNKDIDVDVRIIVATNEDLIAGVQRGTFREDLFHRLNEFKINVPPLRSRGEDILLFANYFLEQANRELKMQIAGFDNEVTAKIMNYSWPGNIRELKNTIRRAVLVAQGSLLTLADLPPEILSPLPRKAESLNTGKTDLKALAESQEREAIEKVLKQVHYNRTQAAQLLNIDRKTLYNKIKQYGIEG
ncbi:MAG: sigma-54 dependent transcriptional regulator, partial [Lentimicrobiaceae bacterium]|nr:sigma-54 dependent transcriptional regulator [Lentimicrobiaceae bacterium]